MQDQSANLFKEKETVSGIKDKENSKIHYTF